jgi:hypothetical protein
LQLAKGIEVAAEVDTVVEEAIRLAPEIKTVHLPKDKVHWSTM